MQLLHIQIKVFIMFEISPCYLLNVVDKAIVFKIWKSLVGMKVYTFKQSL